MQTTDEISYILSGNGWLTTNGKGRPVGAGCVVIASKGVRQSLCNLAEEPLELFVAAVSAQEERPVRSPALIPSLPSFLHESEEIQVMIGNCLSPLRLAQIDLAPYFSSAWGTLTLLELPPGARTQSVIRRKLGAEELSVTLERH